MNNNIINQEGNDKSSVILDAQPSGMNLREMSSLEIAELTGKKHAHVMRDIRKMIENLKKSNESISGSVDFSEDYHRWDRTQYKYLSPKTQKAILDFAFGKDSTPYQIEESFYKDEKGESRTMYSLNKKASLLLASGYNVTLRAKIIDRWESLETGKALPVYQVNSTHVQQVLPLKEQLSWAKEVKKLLNLSDSSTLGMLQKIAKAYGNQLPLPDYTPSKGITKSATALLKEHDIDLSARKFNEILLKEGFLRKVERKSSKGMKAFLNLTEKGLAYGENVVSPHNPNETQPHFYQESFGNLLSLLNIQSSGKLFNEN